MQDNIQDKTAVLKPEDVFYNAKSLLGYNAMVNFVISGRGPGKTFEFKRRALTMKGQFIWLRRYANDLPDVENEFMSDLYQQGLFLDEDIKIIDNRLKIGGQTKIFFVALNVAAKKKSVAYPNVDYIVFDEFIETKPRRSYLPKECESFLDFMETVNRLRLDRPEIRCFLLGNKVSFVNPYFTFFGIRPFKGRFKKFKKGLIVVENWSNTDFIKLKKQSRFGQLIEGTRYSKYAIENESFIDNPDFIRPRPSDSVLKLNIRMGEHYYGVWQKDNDFYVSQQSNKAVITYAPRMDLKEGEFALKSTDVPIWLFKELSAVGQLWFEDNICKDMCYMLMEEVYK